MCRRCFLLQCLTTPTEMVITFDDAHRPFSLRPNDSASKDTSLPIPVQSTNVSHVRFAKAYDEKPGTKYRVQESVRKLMLPIDTGAMRSIPRRTKEARKALFFASSQVCPCRLPTSHHLTFELTVTSASCIMSRESS